ncbi:MAG: hypothetical protein ACJA0U_001503 [Salibacteraceae bacterium]|jgi:hypothetical protein
MIKTVLLLITIVFSVLSFGQKDTSQKIPPLVMLPAKGEVKTFFELSSKSNYKIYDQNGSFIDSGYAQFIDYTDYKAGKYFVRYDGNIGKFEKITSPILTEQKKENKSYVALIIILTAAVLLFVLIFFGIRLKRIKSEQAKLLHQFNSLKKAPKEKYLNSYLYPKEVTLDRKKIEEATSIKLNESDWKIIHQLIEFPSISNIDLANQVSLSVEGTRSSLKKMYRNFEIPSSRNMRLTLVIKLIYISKKTE